MMAKAAGWIWMGGVIAALIAIQAVRELEPLASVDRTLNAARGLVPAGIGLVIVGLALLIGAAIHGLVFDATRAEPGEIEGVGAGRTPRGGWGVSFFKGRLLWGASFDEETGISELKRSWFTGEWLEVHRYLRETLVVMGLPLVVVGFFGTIALATDVTAVRLLLILVVGYTVGRLAYVLIRA